MQGDRTIGTANDSRFGEVLPANLQPALPLRLYRRNYRFFPTMNDGGTGLRDHSRKAGDLQSRRHSANKNATDRRHAGPGVKHPASTTASELVAVPPGSKLWPQRRPNAD